MLSILALLITISTASRLLMEETNSESNQLQSGGLRSMLGMVSINCEENEHCANFYDGCNVCECDGGEISWCTERLCADDSMGVSYCVTCEYKETMEYTRCGSCDQTCD